MWKILYKTLWVGEIDAVDYESEVRFPVKSLISGFWEISDKHHNHPFWSSFRLFEIFFLPLSWSRGFKTYKGKFWARFVVSNYCHRLFARFSLRNEPLFLKSVEIPGNRELLEISSSYFYSELLTRVFLSARFITEAFITKTQPYYVIIGFENFFRFQKF